MLTGIALLPPLHEHQNENDDEDFESSESEDEDYDDAEVNSRHHHLHILAMTNKQHFEHFTTTEYDDSTSNNNNNNENKHQETANCLSSLCAGGNNNKSASTSPSSAFTSSRARHDLLPCHNRLEEENDPTNNSSIINVNNNNGLEANSLIDSTSPIASPEPVILRSPSVVLTTNMALDSFRRSVCIENDANIDLDAILNDLESLTQMLKSELRPEPQQQQSMPHQPHKLSTVMESPTNSLPRSSSGDSGNCGHQQNFFQGSSPTNGVELRRKPTSNLSPTKAVVVEVLQHHHHHQQQHISWNSADFSDHSSSNQAHQPSPPSHGTTGSNRASIGDSDSAFSDSGSTPTGSSGTGNASVANSQQHLIVNSSPTSQISAAMTSSVGEDEASRLAKEEKIRIALEKIREAQIRKLCIRIFGPDETTSKTLFIDETTTVRQVIHLLAAKNHVEPNVNWAVVEYYPDLYSYRVIEDHESLVANMLLWKPDSPNSVRFEMRPEKYDLFARPEVYLSSNGDAEDPTGRGALFHGGNADHARRLQLVQECFSDISVRLPHLEMSLHLKHPTKKSWRKLTFFMRGSGLYYTTKSKGKASAKDLVCLAQFEHVNLYVCSPDYQKKFKAPTPFGFVLKHPQLQKRCKYVHYLCADSEQELARWCTCIRLAKYGKQLAENYATLAQDIAAWPVERGLSAAGLLQKVTGLPAPAVTPLRHSFTPSMGSGTTITDDRSTPSSAIMSSSAAARLASSAEQLMGGGPQNHHHIHYNQQSELIQQYPQHRVNHYTHQQTIIVNEYDCVSSQNLMSTSSSSPRSAPDEHQSPLSPAPKSKKKHIRFSDEAEEKQRDELQIYEQPQVSFPPPPPILCHDYDTLTDRSTFSANGQRLNTLSPSHQRVISPEPNQYDNTERAMSPAQQLQEMPYGIIVKPPVPAKPRGLSGPLSPRPDEAHQQQGKPAPPPRTTSSSSRGGMQMSNASANSAAATSRALVDITGELDKLLSARAARLERLWNQEEDSNGAAASGQLNFPPPASTLLMASQDLSSEDTGTIKKRPPPPPRRS